MSARKASFGPNHPAVLVVRVAYWRARLRAEVACRRQAPAYARWRAEAVAHRRTLAKMGHRP